MQLEGAITLPQGPFRIGHDLWVRFTIRNQTDAAISIVNPDVGVPPEKLGWRHSNETYQVAILCFFHILSISLTTEGGAVVPFGGPQPWVTPILMPPLQVQPGASFALRINLADHFDLRTPGRLHLTIRYGDQETQAQADADFYPEGTG